MPSTLVRWLRHTANAGLLLAFSTLSAAAATEYEKHADGFAVYMGVLPAQVLRGNADASHLATMHGGLPTGSGSHHLVIAIYDERTQRQVEGADVMADVTPLGLGPTRRKLEHMPIAPVAPTATSTRCRARARIRCTSSSTCRARLVTRKCNSVTPTPGKCRSCTRSRPCLKKRGTTRALGAHG